MGAVVVVSGCAAVRDGVAARALLAARRSGYPEVVATWARCRGKLRIAQASGVLGSGLPCALFFGAPLPLVLCLGHSPPAASLSPVFIAHPLCLCVHGHCAGQGGVGRGPSPALILLVRLPPVCVGLGEQRPSSARAALRRRASDFQRPRRFANRRGSSRARLGSRGSLLLGVPARGQARVSPAIGPGAGRHPEIRPRWVLHPRCVRVSVSSALVLALELSSGLGGRSGRARPGRWR